MAKRGVILIATGSGAYAQWAANMATSIRANSPELPIAVLVDSTAKSFMREEENSRIYDHIIDVQEEHIISDGKFAPGKLKLNIDQYSPFEESIYVDVDGLVVKPLEPLFDLCEGKSVASQVNCVTTEENESWPCQWMGLPDVKKVYGLPDKFSLPEINSSFLYFTNDKQSKDFFDVARQCFIPEYKTLWGGSFPDELALNVAAGLLGMDLSITDSKAVPVVFQTKAIDPAKFEEHQYIIGLYGEMGLSSGSVYNIYERYANKYFVKIHGRTCPYKYGQLMKSKFVSKGRSLRGQKITIPDPIKIILPNKQKNKDIQDGKQ